MTNLANVILVFYYLARVNVNFHEGLQFIATVGKGAMELTGFYFFFKPFLPVPGFAN